MRSLRRPHDHIVRISNETQVGSRCSHLSGVRCRTPSPAATQPIPSYPSSSRSPPDLQRTRAFTRIDIPHRIPAGTLSSPIVRHACICTATRTLFSRAVHITSADGPGTIYFGTTCWVGCPSEARRMVEQERSPVASTAPRIRYVLESNMLPVFHIYPWSFSSDAASLDRGRRARLRTRTR